MGFVQENEPVTGQVFAVAFVVAITISFKNIPSALKGIVSRWLAARNGF
jgi:hypothetical protein